MTTEKKNIRVGAAGIVQSGSKVLLARRNKEPNIGMLILPGGGVELYERIEDALVREIGEEANLRVSNIRPFKHYELIRDGEEHRIIFYYSCSAENPQDLNSADDISGARFYERSEIIELIEQKQVSEFVAGVLKDWFGL